MNKDYILTQLFNTLPLKGSIMSRDAEGKKVIDGSSDVILPKWRDPDNQHYTPASPETTAPILAAIIDKNLVGIDFDVAEWFNIAMRIVGDKCAYMSMSDKDPYDGHMVFKLGDDIVRTTLSLEDSEELTSGHYTKALDKLFGKGLKGKIDIQYGGKALLYLASSGNHTKTLVTDLDETTQFTQIPQALIYYIQSLLYTHGVKERTIVTYESDGGGLYGDITEAFVAGDTLNENFFTTVTPYNWRNKVKPNFLPKNLSEKPNDYLYAFATKLGSDASVSEDVFTKAIHKINSLCIPPKHTNDLTRETLTPILSGSARINGEVIWRYNENWREETLTITDGTTKTSWAVYFDTPTGSYLWFNLTDERYQIVKPADSLNMIKSLDKKRALKWAEKTSPVSIIRNIRMPYGMGKSKLGNTFNTYKTPKPIKVYHDPSSWEKFGEVDPEFFQFIRNILGTDAKVDYWLRWMATRLKTQNFSKVVWMLDGIGGAGKTPFGRIMGNMMGALEDIQILRSLSRDNVDDKYNEYLVQAWIVMIDELGDFRDSDRKLVATNIKSVTGEEGMAEIRRMRGAHSREATCVTYVLTTNKTFRLFDEANQTRLFYAKTRKVMEPAWINSRLVDKWVQTEEFVLTFAAYLAQNIEPLTKHEYDRVPSWVYKGDSDWLAYNRLEEKPEMALLDIFTKQDKTALMEFLNVETWGEVPHITSKRADIVNGEPVKKSYIVLSRRKGEAKQCLQDMIEHQINFKKFLILLKDDGLVHNYSNQQIFKWDTPPEIIAKVRQEELNMRQNKLDSKDAL